MCFATYLTLLTFLTRISFSDGGLAFQIEDKVIKNHFASEFVYNKYKDMKTCGVIDEDRVSGYTKCARSPLPFTCIDSLFRP